MIRYSLLMLTLLGATATLEACADGVPAPEASENFLLGSWARSAAECKRPEFNFTATTWVIKTDGDGSPVEFVHKNVHYEVDEGRAKVTLSGKEFHPYNHTAREDQLEFIRKDATHVEIVRTKFGNVALVRCEIKKKG